MPPKGDLRAVQAPSGCGTRPGGQADGHRLGKVADSVRHVQLERCPLSVVEPDLQVGSRLRFVDSGLTLSRVLVGSSLWPTATFGRT